MASAIARSVDGIARLAFLLTVVPRTVTAATGSNGRRGIRHCGPSPPGTGPSGGDARRPEPKSRSDHYRIYDDDVWSAIMAQRIPLLERWAGVLADAVEQLPEGSRGRRLRETEAYHRFAAKASVTMMQQWREQKDELIAQLDNQHA